MKQHILWYWVISILCLIVVSVAFTGSIRGERDRELWIDRGSAILKPFKQKLMAALVEGLQEGPENAIGVCRVLAPKIAQEAGSDNILVGRTSHRLRNPDNAPRPWAAPLLDDYAANPGKTDPEVVAIPGGRVGYVEPIYVKTMCLRCHGENIDPPLLEKIEKLYPGDNATGFKAGDFRGLFWVEFSRINQVQSSGASADPPVAAGKMIPYEVGGEPFEGYLIIPSPEAPLILLIHDWDGLTDYEIKRAGMLADLGYAVFAADLFGAGVRPTALEDKRRCTDILYKDREKMRELLKGALETARSKGARTDKVVAMGYCFGGTAVLEFARSGADLQGFVTFHGGLSTPEGQDYAKTKGKLLILHGTADKSISMDEFARLAKELEDAGVSHEMITYGGAPHAFTVFGSSRYREDADKKSWKRLKDFLAETLK